MQVIYSIHDGLGLVIVHAIRLYYLSGAGHKMSSAETSSSFPYFVL